MKHHILFIYILCSLVSCLNKDTATTQTAIPPDTTVNNSVPEARIFGDSVVIGNHLTDYRYYPNGSTCFVIINSDKGLSTSLEGIEQISNLKELHIAIREIKTLDYSILGSLPELEVLDIGGYVPEIPDLSHIPALRKLVLTSADITTLDGLEKIPELKHFEIKKNDGYITSTAALTSLRCLEFAFFIGLKSTLKITDLYGSAETLHTLFIQDCGEIDLTGLEQLHALRELDMSGSISKNINEIGKVTWLRELTMDEKITSIDFLRTNTSLERFYLFNNRNIINGRVRKDFYDESTHIPLDITPLRNLKMLKGVVLQGFKIQHEEVFRELPNLEYAETNFPHGK
jgi:Leucine-rich repeat (LRR) protein